MKIGKDDYAEIYIDLDAYETQEIVIMDISNKSVDSIISINALLNNKLFIELCLKFAQNAEYIEKIQKYKEKFTTYQFPIIEITEASLDTATDIFTRINVGGKGLDVFEIMCAKTYDEEKGFDLYEKREQQLENWEEIGYETIPHSTILQAISLCINGGCSKKHILNCITKDDFINIWWKIDESFSKAIDYMKNAIGVSVSKLLPYDGLMVPFVYYFYKHPQTPSAVENKYLKDYFWRCVLTNKFSDGLESKLTQDATHIIDEIIAGNIPKYEQGVDISFDFMKRNGVFSTGNALIKGLICLLVAQQPRSFKNNIPVVVDNAWLSQGNSKNYHHFFPKNYMKKSQPLIDEILVNHIANITIVDGYLNKGEIKDKAPSDYMSIYYQDNEKIISTMATHFIGDFDEFGIWEDNYSAFFEKRLNAIISGIKSEIIISDIDIVD